jgi:hypothetical protein
MKGRHDTKAAKTNELLILKEIIQTYGCEGIAKKLKLQQIFVSILNLGTELSRIRSDSSMAGTPHQFLKPPPHRVSLVGAFSEC